MDWVQLEFWPEDEVPDLDPALVAYLLDLAEDEEFTPYSVEIAA